MAKHNVASIRVLEKCGFSLERDESVGLAGKDVAELVLVLALRPLHAEGAALTYNRLQQTRR